MTQAGERQVACRKGRSWVSERSPSPRFTLLATDFAGQPGTTKYTDANVARLAPPFYRVGVPEQKPELRPSSVAALRTVEGRNPSLT